MKLKFVVLCCLLLTIYVLAQSPAGKPVFTATPTNKIEGLNVYVQTAKPPSSVQVIIIEYDGNANTLKNIIRVNETDGKLLFRVLPDGSLEAGEHYHSTESAQEFWKALAVGYPEICKPDRPIMTHHYGIYINDSSVTKTK